METHVSLTNERFEKIERHIERYNSEMGEVQKDVAVIKNDIRNIKDDVKNISRQNWYVIGAVILTILVSTYINVVIG